MDNRVGLTGVLQLWLIDNKTGKVKDYRREENLVTTAGDGYYAAKMAALVAPAAPASPSPATGMKLGTGVTAAAKSGAGAALVTYIGNSNNLFDATFPSLEDLVGDTGFNVVYQVSWPAADVTNVAITECVIVNDGVTDATSTAANTFSRVTFAAINKTVDDSLIGTWKHKVLGA